MKDYYAILGINKDATDEEIKSAYRKLANKYHPDHNKDKDATDKMTLVNEAYSTLKDPIKRAQYDQYGDTSENISQNADGFYYKPNANYYDYNRGYFYTRSTQSLSRLIFRIILIFLLINAVISLGSIAIQRLFQGNNNTLGTLNSENDFSYVQIDSNNVAVKEINSILSESMIQTIEISETVRDRKNKIYNVSSISDNAFRRCSNLTSISLPSTITSIGRYAFYGCSKLGTIYFYGTEEQFNKIQIGEGNSYFKNATVIFIEGYNFTI
ncbi:DnaJ domain-containing protein [bacterium]|nr:DnaJ domain-containing protein [bacterium]